MPNISIIVPIYNAESHIKKCLDNLLKQDFAESFEIILVNDASTDNSIDLIKKFYGYSYTKAKDVVDILSEDQIEHIRSKLDTGGLRKE